MGAFMFQKIVNNVFVFTGKSVWFQLHDYRFDSLVVANPWLNHL